MDGLHIPISVQIRMPRRPSTGRPHYRNTVNHPANGWQPIRRGRGYEATHAQEFTLIADPDDTASGVPVILPNGHPIPDNIANLGQRPPTEFLMSPTADLQAVADAGRQLRASLEADRSVQDGLETFSVDLFATINRNVGQGGRFDYQRGPYSVLHGYELRRQFWHVSNFNVGLFSQQAGLTLNETLQLAGTFAAFRSSNSNSKQPYGLDPTVYYFIEKGFAAGLSGVYDLASKPSSDLK